MGAPSTPTNTQQRVISQQELPQWYSDYLQNMIGRATSQASGPAPIYGAGPTAPNAPTKPDEALQYTNPTQYAQQQANYERDQGAYQQQLTQYNQAKSQWDSLTPEQRASQGQRIAGLTTDQENSLTGIRNSRDAGVPSMWDAYNAFNSIQGNNPLDAAQGAFGQAANYAGDASAYGQQASGYGAQAAGTDIVGGINPYLSGAAGLASQGAGQNVLGTASPYIQQAVQGPMGLMAASPFLAEANQDIGAATQNALSPYLGGAMNAISDQAAYDLQNKYLPSVRDQFIKGGQYGSTRQQDITAQTINDLSRNVMGQQAEMLNSAYGQAGNLAQANLGLKGQLAQTAGGLGNQQQQALLQAGQGLGSLAGTQGSLQLQGAGQYGNLAGTMGNALSQQGQLALGAGNLGLGAGNLSLGAANVMNQQGQSMGQLSNAYNQSMLGVGQGQTQLADQVQSNALRYNNALYAAGQSQQNLNQQNLDTRYQDWQNQTFYPQNQTSWLSNIVRGLPSQPAGYGSTTTTQVPSNTGAQVGGLLTAGLSLAGGQGGGAGGNGSYGGYYRKGGKVKKYAGGGKVRGLGQFAGAA